MNQERLLKIILSPHISEKATLLAEKRNEYVFEVMSDVQQNLKLKMQLSIYLIRK